MGQPRASGPHGDDDRTAGPYRVLMVDRQILTLWADAARHRQVERLQEIANRQQRPAP